MRLAPVVAAAIVVLGAATAHPSAAPGPPTAGKPRLSALAYRGLGSDRVGRESGAQPNGERDARFTATLRTGSRSTLTGVVLQRVLPQGEYGERWDARPSSPAAILAVYLDGRRLNPADRDLGVPLAPGAHRLDVHANDHHGVFAPGERFRLTASFPGFATASATARIPGAAPRIASVRFAGRGADVAGRGVDQTPNGEPDAHFVVVLDLRGTWQILENVSLRRLGPGGVPSTPLYWMQSPQTAGLRVGGVRHTWPTSMEQWIFVYVPLDPRRGAVRIDLYANDPTPEGEPSVLFRPGVRYELSIEFTDSELIGRTAATIRLP